MSEKNIKGDIVNNIILEMSNYIDKNTIDILQKTIEEQLVFVNMEEITTLPAVIKTSVQERNKYFIDLMEVKKKNLTPETKKQYRDAVTRLINLIEKPLTEMDTIDIDYYLHWYEKRHIYEGKKNKATTCNNERRFLSAFFTWMRKEKFILYNPVETTEPLKEVREPIDYFSLSQMEDLRCGCRDPRDRAILEVFRSTGARIGEIVSINISDIDFNTGDAIVKNEKNNNYRTLYIDEIAMRYLKKYLDTRTDNNEALFVWDKKPYCRLQRDGLRAIMKKIAKNENLEYRVYPHKMRKTLGMYMMNRGFDIGVIQNVMGHANPTVTSRYYAQLTSETMRFMRKRAMV